MKRLLLPALLFVSSSAFAADLAPAPTEPLPPAPYSWTGFYAGVHMGAVGADAETNNYINGVSGGLNSTGFIGGVHAGYNYELDNHVVIGLEGDIDYTSVSNSRSRGGIDPTGNAFTQYDHFESDWQGSIRARLGYAFDRFLPYITTGVAFANEKYSISGTNAFGAFAGSSNDTRTGWTIGGGLEYALTDSWLLRGELRYTDFGSNSFTVNNFSPKVRFHEFAGTVGVSYKF